jgi:rhodanese-related sulfurtransferase
MIKRLFIQTVAIVGITGFAAILFHSVAETGFLKNPVAVADVACRYYAVDVPEIALNDMKQVVEQNNAVIFDARYRRDFERGRVPGAVNFPIDSDLAGRKTLLQGIDKSAKIVLYCQSSRCGFADEIASFLKFNEYRNVSVFRGGYREWSTDKLEP